MNRKGYCPVCDKFVSYRIRKDYIKEFKGYDVNVEENIAVCVDCSKDIYVSELESENFKRLYSKFEELGGIIEKFLSKDNKEKENEENSEKDKEDTDVINLEDERGQKTWLKRERQYLKAKQ